MLRHAPGSEAASGPAEFAKERGRDRIKLCTPAASSLSLFSASLNYSGNATKATRVVHGRFIGFLG
jgi:hypothetical protein